MDSAKGIGGNLHLEDGGVPGNGVPSMLEETLSELRQGDADLGGIPDWSEEQLDFLLKIKLNDVLRETLPTDHSQWRLM
ncbi:MAG: hypothetical protein V5B78_06415 [Desulfohalobiaceae bacterium]